MLILTRRLGEAIFIKLPNGQRVQVAVSGVKAKQVRFGVEAADEVVIV